MFKKRKEMQSLINESRKALDEAETKIKELTLDCKELREIRKEQTHNNTILVNKNRELTELLNKVNEVATSNTYNNDKMVLNKIKELVQDYQSKN